jgi:hypothetical protein
MIQVLKEAQLAAQQHQLELLDLESSASLDWILQNKAQPIGNVGCASSAAAAAAAVRPAYLRIQRNASHSAVNSRRFSVFGFPF